MENVQDSDHVEFNLGASFYGSVTAKLEHHHNGPVPVATAYLPAAPVEFTGRDDDLARLIQVLDPAARTELPVLICAVSGLGGIGKTALTLYAAHRATAKGWFPGGSLFIDLRGYDDHPVTADQAVLALLDSLGVRGLELPPTTPAQYALYRTLLAERHDPMLLVLDNASHPAQITPLVPGTDRHRVIVTSRDLLVELPAQLLNLDVLPEQASADLITRALHLSDPRDDRPSREPDALRELAALCGGLPLALQMTAAMLRRRRHRSIASMVVDLRAVDRMAALDVRPILDLSYARLPAAPARLLRLLAIAPPPELDTNAAAAAAGLPPGDTFGLLEFLSDAAFVTPVSTSEPDGTRWRLHDLVREFAAGLVTDEDEAQSAQERVLNFYAQWAGAASRHLLSAPDQPESDLFEDREQALAWMDAERANLVAVVQWSADHDHHARTAIRLGLDLSEYLVRQGHFDDAFAVSRPAQLAAERIGDREAEAATWGQIGVGLLQTGQTAEAIDAHSHARDIYQALGNRNNEARAWNNLGIALHEAGQT